MLLVALALVGAGCGRGLDESLTGVTTSTAPPPTTTTTTLPVEVVTTTTEPAPPPEPVTVWAPPEYAAAIQAAADEFAAAAGATVEVVPLALDEIAERARGGFAATDPPDLFLGEHTWLGDLRAAGLVVPTGLDSRAGEFVAVAADAFRADNQMFGAPVTLSSIVLYRNPGLVPEPPTGMSQVKEVCEQLAAGAAPGDTTTTAGDTTTTTTAGDTTTTAAAPGDIELANCLVLPTDDPLPSFGFVTAPGGYLVGRDEFGAWVPADVGLAGEAALEGAGFLAEVVSEGFVSGAPTAEAEARFAAGAAPFLFGGPDARAGIGDTAFATSSLPSMGGNTPAPPVVVRGFYLNGSGDQAEQAGVLLRDHLTTAPTMRALYLSDGLAPAYGTVAAEPGAGTFDAEMLASAERGVPLPSVAGVDGALAALRDALAAILVPAEGDDAPSLADIMQAAAEGALAAVSG